MTWKASLAPLGRKALVQVTENQCKLPKENQSSNIKVSGQHGGLHSIPTPSAAREKIAVISGSDSCITAAQRAAKSSSGSPFNAAIDIRLSGVCKDTAGTLFERAQRIPSAAQLAEERKRSDGASRVCSLEGLPSL